MPSELLDLIVGILLFILIGIVGRNVAYLIWYFFKWLIFQRPQLDKMKEPISYG